MPFPIEDFSRRSQRLEEIFSKIDFQTPPPLHLVAEGTDLLASLVRHTEQGYAEPSEPYVFNCIFHCRIEPQNN